MLNEIFAFLPGCDIIHKIALLNKRIRNSLAQFHYLATKRFIDFKIKRGKSNFPLNFKAARQLMEFSPNLRFIMHGSNY